MKFSLTASTSNDGLVFLVSLTYSFLFKNGKGYLCLPHHRFYLGGTNFMEKKTHDTFTDNTHVLSTASGTLNVLLGVIRTLCAKSINLTLLERNIQLPGFSRDQ